MIKTRTGEQVLLELLNILVSIYQKLTKYKLHHNTSASSERQQLYKISLQSLERLKYEKYFSAQDR